MANYTNFIREKDKTIKKDAAGIFLPAMKNISVGVIDKVREL